jgi:hypothetical protein
VTKREKREEENGRGGGGEARSQGNVPHGNARPALRPFSWMSFRAMSSILSAMSVERVSINDT